MRLENIKYSMVRLRSPQALNTQSKARFGLTLVELMVTILIATLVVAGIGVAMVDSIKSFPLMHERTTGNYQRADAGVIPDSYVARATFDRICRQASVKDFLPATADTTPSDWITLWYYSSPSLSLTDYDKCAKFALESGELRIYYGTDATGANFGSPVTLAKNVTDAKFLVDGSSVIMTLTIDNTSDTNARQKMKMTVTSAAKRHNDWP